MSVVSWRCVFYFFVLSFVVTLWGIRTDATLEGSSMGYLSLPNSKKPVMFPGVRRVSGIKVSREGGAVVSRHKRNILFPSGVKLCAQETVQQVISTHLSYFHLRVCQETIWEAFKIFLDRLPEQEEYQHWMSQCQDGAVTTQEIGTYFSQSEEHQALVKKRMSSPGLRSEPTRSWQHMCSTPTSETPQAVEDPEPDELNNPEGLAEDEDLLIENAILEEEEEEESLLDNDISLEAATPAVLEQVVELSILLMGETYSASLDDRTSAEYQALSTRIVSKIEDSLQGLPGFKSVSVVEFRHTTDNQGLSGVVVDYAVALAVEGSGVSSEQLDYLTLQSNLVENSYHEIVELPTVIHAISEVKDFATEALQNNELNAVSEVPESVNAADEAAVDGADEPEDMTQEENFEGNEIEDVLPEPSETNTVATEDSDVVVLEESEEVPPPPPPAPDAMTTSEPEVGSIEEEELLLEESVQTPAVENSEPEAPPAEPPSPDASEDVALPEPPVEVEASGSDDLEDLLLPSTDAVEEEEEVTVSETNSEDGPVAEVHMDVISEAEPEEVEAAAGEDGGEPEAEAVEEEHLDEVVENEEGLPGVVSPPEAVEVASEGSEPEPSLPVGEDLLEAAEEESNLADEVNHEEPVEEEDLTAVSVLEDGGLEEATEMVTDETLHEAPAAEEEAPMAPEISVEDRMEDEILPVNAEELEPPVTDALIPPQPTALSPEEESPFTRVAEVAPASEPGQPGIVIPSLVEIQTTDEGLDDATNGDVDFDLIHYGLINHTEEGSTGFPFGVAQGTDLVSLAMPANPGRALMVFFSLRVTNMIFSEDLFNKSSPEYKALEQRFLELLVPYLQSNLTNFENLEILNFRNGSIVVNSRMKFGKPVQKGTTTTVYLILEDFCNTAYQTMNLAIDKYSLDVESGDKADPCKFQACNEYAECKVNKWSGEAECVCNAGYFSVDSLPCQSICELQHDFCLNDGKCDIIPGQGAICRCRVGENWWYRGEHCEEYVSEPLVVGIAIASVAGFLLVASGVIFFLARTLRDQYDKDESEDPIRGAESLPSLERATKYNPMYESEATTGYSHYYRRYPEAPVYSSASAEASTDFSSEEIRHIYENSELTKEEIQDRIRIIELYAKDRQFADFVRQHQAVLDTRRESSSAQT